MTGHPAADIAWMRQAYPGFGYARFGGRVLLTGPVTFTAHFEAASGLLLVGSSIPAHRRHQALTDTWDVIIDLDYGAPYSLPLTFDRQGRVARTARRSRQHPRDLHLMDNGAFCVATEEAQYEALGPGQPFQLRRYLEALLVPCLYAHSFFERFNAWPWPNYSHGDRGRHEWRAGLLPSLLATV